MSQGSVPVLRSYTGGAWRAGRGEGVPLHDAVTGEPIARISSAGIGMAAALDHGRRAGGPALRELTFHQRAALLKALASHLREHREELYALSARTGATPGDSRFDVDGGIAVLNAYASKGRRELPNDTVYVDGAVEPLSKGGTFAGQHIATSLRGVAIQINAFNFPVWGPLEKLAPAFLAGVPTLIKPASQTAYLTGKLAELIISSGLLPEGTVQLICGSPVTCWTTSRGRTWSRSPGQPPPRSGCAPIPGSFGIPCVSTPKPTRSTAPSSAPTRPPAPPSSICTCGSW